MHLGKSFVIARNTFREAVRDRVFYGLVGFAIGFILIDLFVARLASGDAVIVKSFGLAGVYLFGSLITIFLGSSLVSKEIERHTLYFVLAKPVSHADVIVGKFFGLFMAVAATTILMALFYLGVIFSEFRILDLLGLSAIGLQLLEAALFTAILIFLSSLVRPLTATISAVLLLFVGHLLEEMLRNATLMGEGIRRVAIALYYLLPNLEKFNIRNLAVHNIEISPLLILFAFAYAILYISLLLWGATRALKKKEL